LLLFADSTAQDIGDIGQLLDVLPLVHVLLSKAALRSSIAAQLKLMGDILPFVPLLSRNNEKLRVLALAVIGAVRQPLRVVPEKYKATAVHNDAY
jgi:hypothetical protein